MTRQEAYDLLTTTARLAGPQYELVDILGRRSGYGRPARFLGMALVTERNRDPTKRNAWIIGRDLTLETWLWKPRAPSIFRAAPTILGRVYSVVPSAKFLSLTADRRSRYYIGIDTAHDDAR